MDGFWEAQLKPWDTPPARSSSQEAGGRVTGMDGQPWNPRQRPHPGVERRRCTTQMLAILQRVALNQGHAETTESTKHTKVTKVTKNANGR